MELMMKALISSGPHNMQYGDTDIPIPEKGEIRIQVMATGVCGGDIKGYQGKTDPKEMEAMQRNNIIGSGPRIGGHEYAGVVDMIGEGVTNVSIGQRVACYPTMYCGECPECLEGKYNLCDYRKVIKPGENRRQGGFAEYACFRASNIVPLQDEITFIQGAMLEPMGVALHVANRAGDLSGKTVAIIGMGSLGFMTLEAIKLKRPAKIIVLDVLEEKLKLALQHGAHHAYDSTKENIATIIRQECTPIDVVIEAVMVSQTFDLATHLVRNGGIIVGCGLGSFDIVMPWRWMIDHEITLIPCITYTTEMYDSAELIRQKEINIDYIASTFSMDKGPEIMKEIEEGIPYVKVVFIP